MLGLIALIVLVVPVAELIVILKVGSMIGFLPTLALLVLVSFLGAGLVKREGLGLLARANGELQAGRMPTNAVVDGILLLVAGALLLAPGFITDALGVLLLLPPVRVLLRRPILARYRRRASLYRDGRVQVRDSRFGRIITVVDVPSSGGVGDEHPAPTPPTVKGELER